MMKAAKQWSYAGCLGLSDGGVGLVYIMHARLKAFCRSCREWVLALTRSIDYMESKEIEYDGVA